MEQIVTGSDTKSSKNAQRAGSVRWRDGKADVRLSLGPLGRKTFQLPTCKTEPQAEKRRALLSELAEKLLAAGRIELGFPLLERAAQREGTALADVVRAVDAIANGDVVVRPKAEMTFRQLGEMWTSGEIARRYPDHVEQKATAGDDVSRLEKYVYPLVGDVPVSQFTRDHGKLVMERLAKKLGRGTRRHVAQVLHRPLTLAVEPLGLIKENPLPRGFVPKPARPKLRTFLYPDEDHTLLGSTHGTVMRRKKPARVEIALVLRVLYAFLIREGLRKGEALRLEWRDLDLARGILNLLKNKTKDPRSWPMRPDVVRALRAWKAMREATGDRSSFVFPTKIHGQKVNYRADALRTNLLAVGIDRAELHKDTDETDPTGMHALRAAFVTLNQAVGKDWLGEPINEKWIRTRTGHRSSTQLAKYDRLIDAARQMKLAPLGPMDELIPEIAAFVAASSEPASTPAPAPAACSASAPEPCPAPAPEPASTLERGEADAADGSGESMPRWSAAGPRRREGSRRASSGSKNAEKWDASLPPATCAAELGSDARLPPRGRAPDPAAARAALARRPGTSFRVDVLHLEIGAEEHLVNQELARPREHLFWVWLPWDAAFRPHLTRRRRGGGVGSGATPPA